MTAFRRLSLALGLALAVTAPAYASPPDHHHYRRTYHRTVVYRAAPQAPALESVPNVASSPTSYASHRQYEIEGLTRNPDDCVRYGCIGSN